ncbi:hypothetical protein NQ315_011503 [Exocentrus adspersus]|uniref:Glutamate dehydrogenase n=1 Tax=Exocentrus adspersus TaxID=1586481 RepID=A0AAV8VUK5_9CUCU|nr:hypothetical protein NQ315_011503 [Exocentrus adspersus]
MAFRANYKFLTLKPLHPQVRSASTVQIPRKLPYEIPERYRNAFYLANAALFDSTNWFLHRAYEVAFPTIKKKLANLESYKNYSNDEIAEKVEEIITVLDQCNSIIDVRFPVKRDNGSYEMVRGFRAQHGLTVGYQSCLGGLRIHENITRDHMKGLAVLATYRNACMGINMGGAHGGIKIRPQEYSLNELQRIVELYTMELIKKGYSGERDVIQPDVNTSEREMTWINKTFAKCTGRPLNMASAGKSSDYGGFENYEKTSSQGAFHALDFFLNNEHVMNKIALTTGIRGKTFIIQGLGKLGTSLAELLVTHGAVCVGVKEHDAYIYDANGINLKELYEYRKNTGSIMNYGLAKPDVNDSIYTEQCDILVFAAYQKSLICYIANNVKAKVILEAADGAVTPTSHRILTGRSKLVIPDIYACSGATITSYLEYLRNLRHMQALQRIFFIRFSRNIYESIWNRLSDQQGKIALSGSSVQRLSTEAEPRIIAESLECVLSDTGNEIVKLLEQYKLGTDARTAAYMIGIENIFNAIYYQRKLV